MSYGEQDKKELIIADQRLNQWHEIWQARVSGKSTYQIAKAFGLTIGNVKNILAECRKEFRGETKNNVEEEMHLDLARCDEMLSQYQPVAAAMTVMVQRMNANGDAFTDDEWKYPLAAAKIVLDTIKLRGEILGYKKDGPVEKGQDNDSILWMRRATEAKVVRTEPVTPVNTQDAPLDLSWPE
jgi:hypothetical protein